MVGRSDTSAEIRELLVVGAYGVIGTGIIDAAVADPHFRVATTGRRAPPAHHFASGQTPPNVKVNLLDRAATLATLSALKDVTDLAFSAYVDGSTMASSIEENVAILENTLDAFGSRDLPIRNVVLMGGAKSYGFHLGSMKSPARESDPRLLAPILYHQQEDILAEWAQKHGAHWTVLRPHMVFGPSIASPMNLITGLGTFAALSRELGVPLRFPGSRATWSALHDTTDAQLLGRATLWAIVTDSAYDQIFNVGNGDHFRWIHMWKVLGDFYDIPLDEPQPMIMAGQMNFFEPLRDQMVAKYQLVQTPYQQIANWGFLDACLNFTEDVVLSTVKVRKAGFSEAIDSHESLIRQLSRLRNMKLIP